MLGLGLGLSKGTNLLSNLKLLTRNADFAFWIDKATGTSKGTNTPQVNPIQDLVGVVGKNLFDLLPYLDANINLITNGISLLNGGYPISKTNFLKLLPNETYTIKNVVTSISGAITASVGQIALFNPTTNESLTLLQSVGAPATIQKTFTTPSNISGFTQIRFYPSLTAGSVVGFTNLQLELGTVATAYEPYGKSNGLLQGFAFTPASGYVDVVAPNGKTVTGVQGDGVNDVILLPSNAPNPTSGNFAFGLIVKTGANKIKYLLTRNVTNDADTQYAFKFDVSGNLFVILEGVAIQIGTALSAGLHSIWLERDSGVLKAFIDGVETYSGAHVTTLTSRANTVMMASTTGTGTYTGFSNDLLLASKYCDSDIATNRADWFKFDTKVYGL